MMKGRPILGVISGFFFGLFSAISLFLWGVIDFHSALLWLLPVVGIVLGLVMASWAPFGSDSEQPSASESAATQTPAAPAPPPEVTDEETGSDEPG
jgi:hypothetical protein